MPESYSLGEHFDLFVQAQLASGRYTDVKEVLRDALRLMETRDRKRAELEAALKASMADIEAGHFRDAEDVFDELEAELESLSDHPVV